MLYVIYFNIKKKKKKHEGNVAEAVSWVANKHVKGYSPSLAMREMQVKTRRRCAEEDTEQLELYTILVRMQKWYNLFGKRFGNFL